MRELVIRSYEDKEGRFRWNFSVDGDIQFASTDSYETIDEAENHAKKYLKAIYKFERIN